MEKERRLFYLRNFIAILVAIPQENKVNPIGNTPLVSISGTCPIVLPEEYVAITIGNAIKPITPSFVFVFLETCCVLYVLIFYQLLYNDRII
jgi:hypothetical protein